MTKPTQCNSSLRRCETWCRVEGGRFRGSSNEQFWATDRDRKKETRRVARTVGGNEKEEGTTAKTATASTAHRHCPAIVCCGCCDDHSGIPHFLCTPPAPPPPNVQKPLGHFIPTHFLRWLTLLAIQFKNSTRIPMESDLSIDISDLEYVHIHVHIVYMAP